MGARDMKGRLLSQLLSPPLGVAVLLLFLDIGSFIHPANSDDYIYDIDEMGAVRALVEAWGNTPNKSSNLAGWHNASKLEYCHYLDPSSDLTRWPKWQGVECSWTCSDADCTARDVHVNGLSLSNASIVGVLPPVIGYITNLITLELTGNPELTGPLPSELENLWPNVLDVHDNAFNGSISSLPLLWNLLRLDLSGNQFTRFYPYNQSIFMHHIEELSVGDNHLDGEIPSNAFTNKMELKKLDIFDNEFNRTLPYLSSMHQLIHLDLSRNKFTEMANLVDIFNLSKMTTLEFVDLSHNQLTGPPPYWNASSLGSIKYLYAARLVPLA